MRRAKNGSVRGSNGPGRNWSERGKDGLNPRMQPFRRFVNQSSKPWHRWLLPAGALFTLTGYFRPWIDHKAAGLAVLGLDLGELVKFLYPVQQGEIRLWREGFYLPLVAVSISLSLNAFRRSSIAAASAGGESPGTEVGGDRPLYSWPVRIAYLLVAIVAALNMLPPAWTPQQLLMPEFRLQVAAMLLCLALVAVSPLAALLQSPRTLLMALGGICRGQRPPRLPVAGCLGDCSCAGPGTSGSGGGRGLFSRGPVSPGPSHPGRTLRKYP